MPLFSVLQSLASTSNAVGGFQLVDIVSSGYAAMSGALRVNTRAPVKTDERAGSRMATGVACIPDPEKADLAGGCGEDAYYISGDVTSFGVSDGVGGWRKHGIDPSAYSRCLMQNSQKHADSVGQQPTKILQHAYDSCKSVVGSATAAVVHVSPDLLMSGVNLGDSGWRVIRDGKVVLRTTEQQWAFNAPNQLGTGSDDRPRDADRYKLKLQPNDVIVMGTDGLFDNLSDRHVLRVYERWAGGADSSPKALAELLAREAHKVAQDPTAVTPFAVNSNGRFKGGKMDDVTSVVSIVKDTSARDDDY